MSKLRVLHMIGSLNLGGSQAMVVNLLSSINKENVIFDFVIDRPEELYFSEQVKNFGSRVYVLPAFNGRNISQVRNAWDAFFAEHSEYKILHSHVRSYASLFIPIAKKHGLKTIVHSHSTSNGKGLSAFVKMLLQHPLRRISDYLFACSLESGKWLFGEKATRKDNFKILKNVIDIDKNFYNPKIREQYRERLGVSDKTVFIHVGRLHPAKNHLFLLNAFKRIIDIDSNSVLLVVGDGELKEDVVSKIDELALKDKVRMLGNRSDVSSLLSAADCFLFPSLWEGVPLTVIEAQAAGLPCLVSDRITDDVCISELVTKLPIDSVEPWAKAVADMDFSRKDVRDKIIEAGYDARTLAAWLEKFYLGALK